MYARLGEQIGVRVDVFNFQAHRIEVENFLSSCLSILVVCILGSDYPTCITELSFC